MHPWLYTEDTVMSYDVKTTSADDANNIFPSDDALIKFISCTFKSLDPGCNASDEVYSKKAFLNSPQLRKAWMCLSTGITSVYLNNDIHTKGFFLLKCSEKSNKSDKFGHMFLSSLSGTTFCTNCRVAKSNAWK